MQDVAGVLAAGENTFGLEYVEAENVDGGAFGYPVMTGDLAAHHTSHLGGLQLALG